MINAGQFGQPGKRQLRALGCHIFAGGFSLGIEKHFEVVAHLERGEYATKTWRRNRPGVPAYVDKTAQWPQVEKLGPVDVVYGNPPCASWSQASGGTVRQGDSLSLDWTRDVLKVADRVEAKVTLVESVRGAYSKGADHYRAFARERGLSLSWFFTNTVDHGLPQNRPRVFLVFVRGGVFVPEWSPPETYARVLDVIAGAPRLGWPEVKVKCASRRGVMQADVRRCIPHIAPGSTLIHTPIETLREVAPTVANYIENGPGWFGGLYPVRCATNDKPTPVVFGHYAKLIHPLEDRMLTFAELQRLQGYPDEFEFCEPSIGTNMTWLGKTVCPPVAEWLAGEVAAYLGGDREVLDMEEAVFDCNSGNPLSRFRRPKEGERKGTATTPEPTGGSQTSRVILPVNGGRVLNNLPVDSAWSALPGPTALARILIAEEREDGEILAATKEVFASRMFTRADLTKLRAKILKKGQA